MLFELREEKVKHLSTGVIEVTERKIIVRNESEINPKYLDMEVGHRKTLSESLDDDTVFSIVRIK
jgi:hypothetical protein